MGLYISDIAGSSLASLEYIPLTLYRAYGLALIIWVWSGDIDLTGCASCPWRSLYEDKRSHDLLSIGVESIAKRARELSVDMVFMHGGEPISKPWLSPLIDRLKLYGVKLGVKARIEMLEKPIDRTILRYVDAILVEIPSQISRDLLKRALHKLVAGALDREDLYIEFLFTDSYPEKHLLDNLAELNRSLEAMPRSRQPIPIGLQAHELAEYEILSLVSVANRMCGGVCYVIESNNKISPEEIKCPRCGTIAARRKGVIVVPVKSEGVECPRCGSKIFSLEPHRIKRTLPVLSPIYLGQ